MNTTRRIWAAALGCAVVGSAFLAPAAAAQSRDHTAGMAHPTEVGQDAYAAIAEIVALLKADPKTDWSRVDIEALRQHLRDMQMVTLQAVVVSRAIDGGAEFDVSGAGEVAAAVRRMATAHAAATREELPFRVTVTPLGEATRVRILATTSADASAVAMIRGLGFIGWVSSGGHHQAHHLAIARGDAIHAH